MGADKHRDYPLYPGKDFSPDIPSTRDYDKDFFPDIPEIGGLQRDNLIREPGFEDQDAGSADVPDGGDEIGSELRRQIRDQDNYIKNKEITPIFYIIDSLKNDGVRLENLKDNKIKLKDPDDTEEL